MLKKCFLNHTKFSPIEAADVHKLKLNAGMPSMSQCLRKSESGIGIFTVSQHSPALYMTTILLLAISRMEEHSLYATV
jgi:hypothetical protein